MKKILLVLLLLLLLVSCSSRSEDDYHIISENPVDGYDIYEYDQSGLFCNTMYTDMYYSDELYNYGYSFIGCSPGMTFFIKQNDEYIYLVDALEMGLITIESLLPELDRFDRESEEIPDEEDYMWLDFWILGHVVYAYCGGDCLQEGRETFFIDGKLYEYTTNGCLKDHILYMQVDGQYEPIANLIEGQEIDGTYLIPLLTEVTE